MLPVYIYVPACHSACVGCSGPGADQCKDCKPGYQRNEESSCQGEHIVPKNKIFSNNYACMDRQELDELKPIVQLSNGSYFSSFILLVDFEI